jgi:hypothetical protein
MEAMRLRPGFSWANTAGFRHQRQNQSSAAHRYNGFLRGKQNDVERDLVVQHESAKTV